MRVTQIDPHFEERHNNWTKNKFNENIKKYLQNEYICICFLEQSDNFNNQQETKFALTTHHITGTDYLNAPL